MPKRIIPRTLTTVILSGPPIVSPPVGWTRTLPFRVVRSGASFRVTGWAIDQNRPTGKIYYVSTAGNDSNDGSAIDAAHALRNVKTALAKADVDEVLIADGTYQYGAGWDNTSPTRNISVRAYSGVFGGVILSMSRGSNLSWSTNETYTHVYEATNSNYGAVYDRLNTDIFGQIVKLARQTSIENVENNPGSWYDDGATSKIYVRRADDAQPSITNSRIFYKNTNGVVNGAVTIYIENLIFEGGGRPFAPTVTAGPNSPTIYAKNCDFKFANDSTNGSGIVVSGATTYLQGCRSICNVDDGFNYHVGQSTVCNAVEIDCNSFGNGAAEDTDNGSSMHDAGSIVRVNGEYYSNVGPNIHDITSSTQSWNLGTNAHDSASAVNDSNFAVGTGGSDTAKMWLENCMSSGSAKDIVIDTNATAYIRNFAGEGNYTGTPTPY